jgi:glucokinase
MVVSGIGLTNLYHFTHGEHPGVPLDSDPSPTCRASLPSVRATRRVRTASRRWRFSCRRTGRRPAPAVRTVATRGLYIGGGIAPKNIALLSGPEFLDAFTQKGPMTDLLQAIPIKIITNAQAGLLGAATYANEL